MSEAKVYARLREHLIGQRDRVERVENGLVVGMPDVNYCILGAEGWIEIKNPEEPVRPTTALFSGNHQVSADQCNWMLRQTNAGGRCWLFIATKQRLMLINGERVGALGIRINKMTAHELEQISAWKVLLPVLDPLRWADLRERLST
jgi:hypothetical protein